MEEYVQQELNKFFATRHHASSMDAAVLLVEVQK